MANHRRPNRRSLARGAALFIGAVLLLALAPLAHAQRMLETVSLPESGEQIRVIADHVATWEYSGHQILLLRGNVSVNQGATQILARTGAAWVDLDGYDRDRVWRVVVYGEDGIGLTHKTSAQADYGYVRLTTTHREINIQARMGKTLHEDLSSDQGYRRALANQPVDLGLPRPKADVKPRLTTIIERKDEDIRNAAAIERKDEGIRLIGATQPRFDVEGGAANKGGMPVTTTYFQVQPVPVVPGTPPEGVPPPPVFSPTPPPPPPPGGPQLKAPKLAVRFSMQPRTMTPPDIQFKPVENNMTAVIVTGSVSLFIVAPPTTPGGRPTAFDIEADRLVIWTPGNGRTLLGNMQSENGSEGGAHEIYMAGNVEIRTRTAKEVETLRADEIYLDVRRNVAVARQADLEIQNPGVAYPIHVAGVEIIRENEKLVKIARPTAHASQLPSDPGLKVDFRDATIEERQVPRGGGLFGLFPAYDQNGQPRVETQRIFTGRNLVATLEGVPFLYFPYVRGRVEDPLGPLDNVNISYDRILGLQINTTWDIFELLNLNRPDGSRWRLMVDYLSARGPFFGTEYDFSGRELLGTNANYSGLVKLYGGWDKREDTLGGGRGTTVFFPDEFTPFPISHPNFRGWANGKVNVQELPNGFSVLGQFNFLSDRNFLEQYFFNSHLNDLNQDTYIYAKQQDDIWAWSILGQFVTRDWFTQTDWLPRADGYLLGRTFGIDRFDDLIVYNAHASAGYARLRPTEQPPFAFLPNDVRRDAARLDLWQDLSVPFYLGPVKLAPYLVLDAAYYSQDTAGDSRGRLYGGGGMRWNMPLSRLYPEIHSDFFNVDGIYHKINLTGNYHYAQASSAAGNFPLFDRLNDDSSDQALRDIRPLQNQLNPANAAFLNTSGLFNPQTYAIRRLIDSNVDTFDNIHVVQLGVRQRWQTQRGFPGAGHVVDYMTLNLQASVFPQADRDNFGRTWGILEYDWIWNIGDRVALTSSGWFEPFDGGPRAFDLGALHNRPDGSNLYLGYRQIDPLNSKAVVGAVTCPLSAKYALTASTVWDFGVNVRSYSLLFSRMGTDVMINAGVNFNSTTNSVGVVFEVLPNLARRSSRVGNAFPIAAANIDPMINQR